ncbi:MAG: hypothetical protein NTY08_09915 [Proteobacteria bacterium]|nr:hypothetical protein [Pseudomonadota bacterium]
MGNHKNRTDRIDGMLVPYLAVAFASLAFVNCGQATEISPLRAGLAQPKLAVVTDDEVEPRVESADLEEAPKLEIPKDLGDLLKAKYHVTLKIDGRGGPFGIFGLVHLAPCEGEITVDIHGKTDALGAGDITKLLSLGSIKALDCGDMGTMDLTKALGVMAQPAPAAAGDLPVVKIGDTIALATSGSMTFNPPRPIAPAILTGTKDALGKLNTSVNTVATSKGKKYSGTISMKMTSYDVAHKPPRMSQTFPHAMEWVTKSTGFAGIDPVESLTFNTMKVGLSVSPISMIRLELESRFDRMIKMVANAPDEATTGAMNATTKFLRETQKRFFLGLITGLITQNLWMNISLELVDQEGLDEALAGDDRGEVFNKTVAK